ncbi:hypothetical protein VSDG_06601 [Cytospora chrysosperma]|uniref:STE24 endopeptidase n=1 Tax=Cytospora chrysosperma TaxID=252740 RepID=A0A423VNV4_CYTCH|nr:hypothetical protein VSDG_06601 [Valsa sordida]
MTPLDNAMKSKNMFLAFGGLITAVGVWTIWGGNMFPSEPDPTGDPETWTREEMRRWLAARNLYPQDSDTEEQLLERIKINLRVPRRTRPAENEPLLPV